MRQSVPLSLVDSVRWDAVGAPGIEMLLLNQDPATGARTSLIRSVPRDGIEPRAQYHHCEEEFLCLAGRFTFDGVHWMRPFSYACYPAHVVHGARVSVPGGYLLYLRTGGNTQVYPVAEPLQNEAYHHSSCRVLEPIVVLEHTREPAQQDPNGHTAPSRILRRLLRATQARDAEVTLWEFGDGTRDIFQHFPVDTPLEVLIVRADSDDSASGESRCASYGYYRAGDARPSVDAEGRCVALVHSGPWA